MWVEGGRVSHEGYVGRLLSISGDAAHVLFSEGSKAGQVEYLPLASLIPLVEVASLIADSLDAPEPISVLSVRQTVASSGEHGLVTALGEAGVLDELATIAEEAAAFVAGRIRTDPAMQPVMAALDTDEADEVVALTTAHLLRNAAHEESDDDA